jgi:hypothetical protein
MYWIISRCVLILLLFAMGFEFAEMVTTQKILRSVLLFF